MAKNTKADTPQAQTIQKMRAEGATVGKISGHLNLPLEDTRRLVLGDNYREKLHGFSSGNPIPLGRQKLTKKLFLTWLSEAVARLADLPSWPMGAGQFTYFYSEACWDLSSITALVTVDLRDLGDEAAHNAGDKEAIFRFAKGNRDALRHQWVIDQLEGWRCDGTKESKSKLLKFFTAYSDDGVKRSPKWILENIRRDQEIYRDSLNPTMRPRRVLTERYPLGKDGIKDILKKYNKAYKWWQGSKLAKLYCGIP